MRLYGLSRQVPIPLTLKGRSLITSSYFVPFWAVQRRIHSPSPAAVIVAVCVILGLDPGILASLSCADCRVKPDNDIFLVTTMLSLAMHSLRTGFQLISLMLAFSGRTFAVTRTSRLFASSFVEPSAISSILRVGTKSFSA